MTEEEAKTKWCPFVRITTGNEQYHACNNRSEVSSRDAVLGTLCIGSDCMAWRVRHMSQTQREAMVRDQMRLGQSRYDALVSVNDFDVPDGFCGLAGAPQ